MPRSAWRSRWAALPERLVAVLSAHPERLVRRRGGPVHPGGARPAVPAAARHRRLRRPPRGVVRRVQRRPAEAVQLHPARRAPPARRCCTSRARWPVAPSAAPGCSTRTIPQRTNRDAMLYLNRLSDLLFILARVANPGGDVLWKPGGERSDTLSTEPVKCIEVPADNSGSTAYSQPQAAEVRDMITELVGTGRGVLRHRRTSLSAWCYLSWRDRHEVLDQALNRDSRPAAPRPPATRRSRCRRSRRTPSSSAHARRCTR